MRPAALPGQPLADRLVQPRAGVRRFPPPPVSHRRDGVTLYGQCGGPNCPWGHLIAQRLPNGLLRLSYHGTAEHSIVLDVDQQNALAGVLASNMITYDDSRDASA